MKKHIQQSIIVALVFLTTSGMLFANGESEISESRWVFLITMDQMDQHWVNIDKGARKAVEELGNSINYRWIAPDVKDDAKQIEMIHNAVAGGAAIILIAANGPTAVTNALREASDAGAKIIYLDSASDFPAYQTLATDNKAAGKTAGKKMLAELNAKGVTSGTIGIISVNAATASTTARDEGFRSAFGGTKFTILETQHSHGDSARSKDIAANYITLGSVGIFGTNEGCTVGIGNAIQEAGMGVVGIGFDKSDVILDLLKNGHLLATMAQNPDVMGYEGIISAGKLLMGNDLENDYIDTGVSVITRDDL